MSTFRYRATETNCPVDMDVYLPSMKDSIPETKPVPAVVFFHGGGLTVGNRRSWFPDWLKDRVTASGMAFVSADYRLIPPSTGHDIVDDIQALFRFLSTDLNPLLLQDDSSHRCQIDPSAIGVAGASAGGLCAYLAVIHASPKPKALLALYAMGGDFINPYYFLPKSGIFMRGREVLDPEDYTEYLYPHSKSLQPTSESTLAYYGPEYHIPGFPANPRMLLPRLYIQLGTWLDYYTGMHEPSLSSNLRDIGGSFAGANLVSHVPNEHRLLFPQLHVDSSWPPTYLVHGSVDSAVLVEESHSMNRLLKGAGVDVTLRVVEGQEHSFDKEPGADVAFGGPGGLFEEVVGFLKNTLR